jgi:Ca2+-binding EF-hand superfamily protein
VFAFSLTCIFLGEPFTQDEMEEMLSAAVNVETGSIVYKDFVPLMVIEDNTNA